MVQNKDLPKEVTYAMGWRQDCVCTWPLRMEFCEVLC